MNNCYYKYFCSLYGDMVLVFINILYYFNEKETYRIEDYKESKAERHLKEINYIFCKNLERYLETVLFS